MSMVILRLLYYTVGFLLVISTVGVVAFNLIREFDRYQSGSDGQVGAPTTFSTGAASK